MSAAVVILFALFTAPDGARTMSDVAVVRTTDVCQVIAAEMNASARKSKDIQFLCREQTSPGARS